MIFSYRAHSKLHIMEAPTKKRKRSDKGASKSSKKIAVEAPNSKVSIVSSEEGSWEPVIGMPLFSTPICQ